MIVAGYCRVSTADQANEGVSLDAQRERFEAWCASRGLPFDPALLFTDAGISGKRSDNRPGLRAALDAVCEGGGILVVYSLSRLARSVRDTLTIAERLEGAGADLVSLSEQIDMTSATGKMVFRLLAVLAEFERDLLSERTRGALAHKRARSERIGQVPYGRRLLPDGRTLVDDEDEREVIVLIVAWTLMGDSARAIAARLGRQGVPAKNGGRWSHRTVARILAREAAHGQAQG